MRLKYKLGSFITKRLLFRRYYKCFRETQDTMFTFWENVNMTVNSIVRRPDPTPPYMHMSSVDFFDAVVNLTTRSSTGVPFGTWIILTGMPGSCKSTLGIQVLAGFSQLSDVETRHYDWEQGNYLTHKMYAGIGADKITEYIYDSSPTQALEEIDVHAEHLAKENKALVVLLDSYKHVSGESAKQSALLAERLVKMARTHSNLLIITVLHKTKGRLPEGAAKIQQLADATINLEKRNNFFYLTTLKNRWQALDAPAETKLTKLGDGPLALAREPDFITNSPVVKLFRSINWSKFGKNKDTDTNKPETKA